ncbi:hypothetical protein AU467_07550 [Mesorhizobium loti]|uniref:Methyltransferase type 11 domain-containing protein n=1 Tax=Rhizobium loti TaxID=381 RepID=A0A101KNV7_RHILI|nr:hypothetical protein AU467_07550 [Mesorhizobium loti]
MWSARAREWADLQEGAFRPLYEAAFDAAEVGKGTKLLDAGCGAGLALRIATNRGAETSGIDAAQNLVAIARERTPDARIDVGEIEELPFGDGIFDVVTGFNSFQYAADRVHGLAEAKRVTKPGGLVVAAVWGAPEKCQMGAYIGALGKLMPPPPPGAPGPWALSEPGALEALIEQAGLRAIRSRNVAVVFPFADDRTAVRGLLAAGPAERAARNSGEEKTAASIAEAIAPYRKPDGSYALVNDFRFVVASA